MKRSGPPARKTPLKAKAPMRRTSDEQPKRRATPREHRQQAEFSEAVKDAVRRRSMGRCEFPQCMWRAVHFHHRLMRSHGGPGTAENCAHLCRHHHDHVHANPAESYANGMLVRGVT